MSNIAGMANITNIVSGQTKLPTQNAIINLFSILDLFIYINRYTSFISLCDTCSYLSEFKKHIIYNLNIEYTFMYYRCNTFRDLVNSKVVSTHQLHFADCKSYYLNLNIISYNYINVSYISNIYNIYTLDLYDNITDDIKSKPYVKKLKPYYTKKAKHFSQKRVFHH